MPAMAREADSEFEMFIVCKELRAFHEVEDEEGDDEVFCDESEYSSTFGSNIPDRDEYSHDASAFLFLEINQLRLSHL